MSNALAPASSALLRLPPVADLIVVGGVPGAGKTTAIAAATDGLDGITVLDPENLHHAIRDAVPDWLPYRAYRALIHTGHTLAVLWLLVLGPTGGRLVVHDPGTRRRRRRVFLGLAGLRGWRVVLVYVDVDRAAARSGQFIRGRVVRAAAFDRHWDRWQQVRDRLGRPGGTDDPPELLVDRSQAASVLRWLCTGRIPTPDRPARPLWVPERAA